MQTIVIVCICINVLAASRYLMYNFAKSKFLNSKSEDICWGNQTRQIRHPQALTADRTNLYLIKLDRLYTIPWRNLNRDTDEMSMTDDYGRQLTSQQWCSIDSLQGALRKLSQTSNTSFSNFHLKLFQLIPVSAPITATVSSTIRHLIVYKASNNSEQQLFEIYWHHKYDHSTWYYTRSSRSKIPELYHLISDGFNRSYVFTCSEQLQYRTTYGDTSHIVLLPSRDRTSDYWFVLRIDAAQSELVFELQGNSEIVPTTQDDKKQANSWILALNVLPLGFISGDKVYLVIPSDDNFDTSIMFIFQYIDISNPFKVLDMTKRLFRPIIPLIVKQLDNFFISFPNVHMRATYSNQSIRDIIDSGRQVDNSSDNRSTIRNLDKVISEHSVITFLDELRYIAIAWTIIFVYMITLLIIAYSNYRKIPQNILSE